MIKIILLSVLTFIVKSGFAQVTSYDFALPLSPNGIESNSVSSNYFGTYVLDDKRFIFDETGIYSKNTIYLTISKKTIRENSSYSVKGNYLFGVKENDSIFCFLEGDKYYYGLREKTELIGENSLHKLVDDGNAYYLNFYENGKWTPAKLEFNRGQLNISYFDYPTETKVFDNIRMVTRKIENGLNNVTLWPTEEEWNKIDKTIIFPSSEVFLKEL